MTGNISKHEIDDLFRDMGMEVDGKVIESIFKFLEKAKNPSYPDFVNCLECFCWLRKTKSDEELNEKLGDFINTFAAMGGNQDKTGGVLKNTITTFLDSFELKIDLNELMTKSGLDENKEELNFTQFCALFESAEKE